MQPCATGLSWGLASSQQRHHRYRLTRVESFSRDAVHQERGEDKRGEDMQCTLTELRTTRGAQGLFALKIE